MMHLGKKIVVTLTVHVELDFLDPTWTCFKVQRRVPVVGNLCLIQCVLTLVPVVLGRVSST